MATIRPLRVLISSGPTRERIDPVRYLSNDSTGYMGARLAAEALRRGYRVTVVSGPGIEPLPAGAQVVSVEGSREMENALRLYARGADAIIMAAAVSDFRPAHPVLRKIDRRRTMRLDLESTPDILARLPRRARQVVVGFALEPKPVVPRAQRKLCEKRLDLLLAQHVSGAMRPFGRRTVDAWLLERGGTVLRLGRVSKRRVARVLLDKVEALWYGQRGFRSA